MLEGAKCLSHCVIGCPILVDILKKWWIVVICLLAVTVAKGYIGLELAKAFNCTLVYDGDPATAVAKAAKMLIVRSSGKTLQAL